MNATTSAAVDLRIYPGLPHTIAEDEILAARRLLAAVGGATAVG